MVRERATRNIKQSLTSLLEMDSQPSGAEANITGWPDSTSLRFLTHRLNQRTCSRRAGDYRANDHNHRGPEKKESRQGTGILAHQPAAGLSHLPLQPELVSAPLDSNSKLSSLSLD